MYGITLLVAIVCAIALTGIRWTRRGGDWDLVLRAAVWGVAAGIVGARLYHVVTSYDQLPDEWWGPFAVWEGGLGIWGGILFGVIAGGIVVWRSGESIALFADCLAPGLLLAQAVGRWGNWWNQELFGKPTDLPWGLDIDARALPRRLPRSRARAARRTSTRSSSTSSSTTSSASGCCCSSSGSFRIRPPGLFALYISWYTLGRLFEEQLRIDPSHEFLGQRLNFWVAAVLFVARDGVLHLVAVLPQAPWSRADASRHGRSPPDGSGDGRPQGTRPPASLASRAGGGARAVLDLDLDTFEGPFDLLLTLILKEELRLAEVDVADIVTSFAETAQDERRLDLEACGRVPRPRRRDARDQGPRAVSRTSRRPRRPEPRRGGGGAGGAAGGVPAHEVGGRVALAKGSMPRRTATSGSGLRRSRRSAELRLAPQDPTRARRRAPRSSRPSRRRSRSPTCSSRFRPSRGSSSGSARCFAAAGAFAFDEEVATLSRLEQASAFLALLELRKLDELRIEQPSRSGR